MNKYKVFFLQNVQNFIETIPFNDQGKIRCATDSMGLNNFNSLYIKTLETPIKELIIKNYRFTFFFNKNEIWFVGAFIKKTAKTPKSEIENAKNLYNEIIRLK